MIKGLGLTGLVAVAQPAALFAGRQRSVRPSLPAQAITMDAQADMPDRTYNREFLAQLADNFRGEVFRKRDDAYSNHPGRTHNWKWGWREQIFDFGCDNYHLQLINEFDDECPDPNAPGGKRQNPQRRLNTHLFVNDKCDPQIRWYRLDDESALVGNATDDDWMRLYNIRRNEFQIDNQRADSTVSIPGAGSYVEKMDRYQETSNPGSLGLDPRVQKDTPINQEHMRLFTKALQGAVDPWTLTVVGQATDLAGNPLCDTYAATAYSVQFDGNGSMGEQSHLVKVMTAILDWKGNSMDLLAPPNLSVHQDPEIALGVPYFNGAGHLEFRYGETNRFKVDKNNPHVNVDFEKLRDAWMYVKPHDPGHNDYRS